MLRGTVGGGDGGSQLHTFDEREMPTRYGLGKEVKFVIGAGGEKSESANVDSGHRDVGRANFIRGIKHRAITTEHGDDITGVGKGTGIDPVRGVDELGCLGFKAPREVFFLQSRAEVL